MDCTIQCLNNQPRRIDRASDISHGCGPAKFRFFREIPRNSQKTQNTAKSARNISKYMSAKHISYLSWLLDLFYSPQTSKFILKLRHCNEQTTSQNYQAFLDERCEKLGTNHNLNSFSIRSFFERTVV